MASTFATASAYNPLTGLTAGKGGAPGYFQVNPFQPKPQSAASTTASASPAPASSITTPGFTPDWGSLIANDSGLLGIQSQLAAGQAADANSRNAAIQQALIQFGETPDISALAQQLGMSEDDVRAAIGSGTQGLAQQATDSGVSTAARLNQAHQDSLMALKNQLNARGLLNSGEAGYQLDKEGTGYRQAQFDARSKLLGYLADYQKGFLQGQAQRAATLAQATSDAAGRQYTTHQGTPSGTATLDHVDPVTGKPVYRGADGSLYNPDGSAWVETKPTTPTPPTIPAGGDLGLGNQQGPRNGGTFGGS